MTFNLFTSDPIESLPTQITGFFIRRESIPASVETGEYVSHLVLLSYIIVVLSSYVALGIASKVSSDFAKSQRIKILCGAIAMGAGIWSMHFIGMLSYKMRMEVNYNILITAISMMAAVVFAGAAFWVIRGKNLTNRIFLYAAPLLGLAVCSMHYIGMAAMQMDAKLLYVPDLFLLSFVIATVASGAALKMMYHARSSSRPRLYNLMAALVMGVAVCGMHYTGMAASVLIPYANCRYIENQDFSGLALAVSFITLLVIFISYLVKQLDEALIETKLRTAQLIQAQKMESVGQLTGGIAHDFNNVLNIIIGNLEVLSSIPAIPEGAKTVIEMAQDNAKKANALTKRLLAFSRNETITPERLKLSFIVDSAADLAKKALPYNVSLGTQIEENLPDVIADPIHFESAILNLVINARDAMPEHGGKILIQANTAQPLHADSHSKKYVSIAIKDTGLGMQPEVLARAREPHFTTKITGNGMGLHMVEDFVKRSGGVLSIQSEFGKGTTVSIFLPILPL